MLVNFDILIDESRVWIYASEQELTNDNEDYILNHISNHLKNWVAHQSPLKAGVKILENRFIVIALDENMNIASGCSIDALQQKLQQIEKDLSISLMNRLNLFCIIGGMIECMPINRLVKEVSRETLFYDLTIQRKSELSNWLKPIKDGWCIRLLE